MVTIHSRYDGFPHFPNLAHGERGPVESGEVGVKHPLDVRTGRKHLLAAGEDYGADGWVLGMG